MKLLIVRYLVEALLVATSVLGSHHVFGEGQLAFPTAEGYGKYTVGGRGGSVYEVTNLNDSGEGSLRSAVEASGPRTVVFKISGTIQLRSALRIKNPYITIAGQTSPGEGICLRGYPLMIDADEVIIRYIRVRFGDESDNESDAISSRYIKNLIIDHVSASWSVDDTVSVYHCENVTVQWCLISESLANSKYSKGSHGFGAIWGSNYSSYHHNLIAHHTSRNPRFASGCGLTDFRNNVIYNWGKQSVYGGEKQQVGNPKFNSSTINMVANYYKPGPATRSGEVAYRIVSPSTRNGVNDVGRWYVADNVVAGNPSVSHDNWAGGVQLGSAKVDAVYVKLEQPWPAMPIEQQTAEAAYELVLHNAGAILPKRDEVDARVVDEVRTGTATYRDGIIDSQEEVGGWPELASTDAASDSDHDGMPDVWELSHSLDPQNSEDRNQIADDGYTMLEHFLNEMK